MKTSDPLELVNILNDRYYEKTLDDTTSPPFGYSTDGNTEVILFREWPLWSSECEGYGSDEDGDVWLSDIVFDLFADFIRRATAVDAKILFYGED